VNASLGIKLSENSLPLIKKLVAIFSFSYF